MRAVVLSRGAMAVIALLLAVSPVFGVVLADMVGYHEPLDIAAERLHLKEVDLYSTPFEDYSFPGLPSTVGYVASGALGVTVILAAGMLAARGLRRGRG